MTRPTKLNLARATLAVLVFLSVIAVPKVSSGYSVLTHEQIVDLLWKDQLQPLLLARFPGASAEELRKAHAYAYGGCVVQDMGYYPFGSKFFSNLVHYVRSGDFVLALLQESSDLDEYAFALGALAHYSSDNSGHPTINRAVAVAFPKLRAKYGEQVTYADDPKAHIQTEFSFDLVQVAKNRYTSDRYHDFIGFEVAQPVLERAFVRTYAIKLGDVFGDLDLAVGTFRRAVSQIIPEMTRVALASGSLGAVKDTRNASEKRFLYYLSRTDYEKEWGASYRRPGFGTRLLAFLMRWIPKIGPFKALAFKVPSAETEDMYIKSIDKTVENYGSLLHAVRDGDLRLPNRDCDTGGEPRSGEYALSDETYAELLQRLFDRGLDRTPAALRDDILAFYAPGGASDGAKKDEKAWRRTLREVDGLRALPAPGPEATVAADGPARQIAWADLSGSEQTGRSATRILAPVHPNAEWSSAAAALRPFKRGKNMLWTILVVLGILWLLGFSLHVGGGMIHLLLVVGLIVLIFSAFSGRRYA